MPAIAKIRLTNVVFEGGAKRFNDLTFQFDGHNGAILLENGGGKTVFIQVALQVILPHTKLAERRIYDTLALEGGPCHLAIEWILNENPRRYGITAVSLFLNPQGLLDSYRYVYEYGTNDKNNIDLLPFAKITSDGLKRPASRGEMRDYYQSMQGAHMAAHTFDRIRDYHQYIEEHFQIIPSQWRNIALINGTEGGVEKFFEDCKTDKQLVEQLLIPVIEETMAGNGTADFIETFQRQREHFKKHKQLRTRIKESQEIQKNLDQYVTLFNHFHLANNRLLAKKQLLKSIWEYWQTEAAHFEKELLEQQASQRAWQDREQLLKQKKASLELAHLKKKEEDARKQFELIELEYGIFNDLVQKKEERLQNLEIAKLKLQIKEDTERIVIFDEQLHSLATDRETEELQQRLTENSSYLNGFFEQEKEKLQKTQTALTKEKIAQEKIIATEKTQLAALEAQQTILIQDQIQAKTTIENLMEEQKNIANDILDNPLYEKVAEEQLKWKNRAIEIEEQQTNYRIKLRQNEEIEAELRHDLAQTTETLNLMKRTEILTTKEFSDLQVKKEALMRQIQELRQDWHYSHSLYQQQDSITSSLEEKLEQCRKEKLELLQAERFTCRLTDDYAGQQYFTPEPSLNRLIDQWAPQFYLLESGSHYLEKAAQSLNIKEKELYNKYPLWPLALITSTQELGKLSEKIRQHAHQFSFPILLFTDEEARNILQAGKKIAERFIFPANWQDNIAASEFAQWKEKIILKSQEATAKREAKEIEVDQYDKILTAVKDFFAQYPYDDYLALQRKQQELKHEIQNTENSITQTENQLSQLTKSIKQYGTIIHQLEHETFVLGNKLQRTQDYLQKEKQKEKWSLDLQIIQENLLVKKEAIGLKQPIIKQHQTNWEGIQKHLLQIQTQLSQIEDAPIYHEVRKVVAKTTTLTRKSLEEERQFIMDSLYQKQADRRSIEIELRNLSTSKKEREESLQLKIADARHPIDEAMVLPLYGEKEMANLRPELRHLRSEGEKINQSFQSKKTVFEKCRYQYEFAEERFYKEFNQIISFSKPLEEIKQELATEKKELQKEFDHLQAREEQLLTEAKEISQVLQELKAKNERYGFLQTDIETIKIPDQLAQKLPYQRMTLATNQLDDLEKIAQQLKKEQDRIQRQKTVFIQFCEGNVQDIKLREMVVSGVETRNHYEEIIEWQQNLQKRISRTIEIAEQDLREHDKDLGQFIHYLHTHILMLVQELRLIPKSTRLRVDDQWREVFSFDIPTWEEGNGKEGLRKHVDWMLAQLESNRFLNDQGIEDQGSVRKSIEQWLQSKQLLQNVLQGREIKIRCRKVTHDAKVSSSFFSWEISNRWSGGEKWSKNMALFLGILNFVAEKRQHLDLKQKRQRTVIMDNPFGKASSEHVLFPVFFIAEQLGFQIIALTAHAGGKFIRDYFPVVYSCKLRPTTDKEGSIITTEKSIDHAFFRDHDPQALNRLEELEQLSLIDW